MGRLKPLREPKVGLGISYSIGGDSYPYTIRSVSQSGHEFSATPDRVTDRKGIFVPLEDAEPRKFLRRPDGRYRPSGQDFGYTSVGRHFAQDPNF